MSMYVTLGKLTGSLLHIVPVSEYGSCPPMMALLSLYRLRASASKLSMYLSIFSDRLLGTLLLSRVVASIVTVHYQWSTNMAASAMAMHCGPIRENLYTSGNPGKSMFDCRET